MPLNYVTIGNEDTKGDYKLNNKFKAAIYIRLSREDGDDKQESNSVTNQRTMLTGFVKSHIDEFDLINIYVDENYSGTNFNRPQFQSMIKDIESGLVNCVICKDLSRFGRDYIETGRYLERMFPEYNVRFVAINDNIDSFKQAYDMLLPVKNVFNQQYAIDISTKVQSAFKTKQSSGQFIGAFTSYGYKKDPNNHNKLIIDEYASQIVKKIFSMYLNGFGKIKIARILNEEGILCPSEYKAQSGLNYTNGQKIGSTTYWTYATIHRLLNNEMYLGHMVQNKTERKMKSRAKVLPKEKWIVVKNTHPSIIDETTWNKTQILLNKNTRELGFNQNVSVFAGFLYCAECGRTLAKNVRGNSTYYICGSYKRYGGTICSSHTITHEKLEKRIINFIKIAAIIYESKMNEYKLKQNLLAFQMDGIKSEIEKTKILLNKTYSLKKGIYEDYKDNVLSKDEYLMYKEDYEKNEYLYKEKINTLEKSITSTSQSVEANKYIKYKDIDKITREIMAECVEKILVHEDKTVDIILTCNNEIGELIKKYSADI
jgi:DNA invertase Pin-like site-specific DNA recombinase